LRIVFSGDFAGGINQGGGEADVCRFSGGFDKEKEAVLVFIDVVFVIFI
jgi:hypothetical protein